MILHCNQNMHIQFDTYILHVKRIQNTFFQIHCEHTKLEAGTSSQVNDPLTDTLYSSYGTLAWCGAQINGVSVLKRTNTQPTWTNLPYTITHYCK